MKKIIATAMTMLILLMGMLSGCQKEDDKVDGKVYATIVFEDFGTVKLELYPDIAPQSVYNFCYLARQGFYDGLTIHRISPGFVIQGGCPEGDGSGGPGYVIKGEFNANGVENNLSHHRGVISMARRSTPMDSAGSQFFIVLSDDYTGALDNNYAGFGMVIEGMDVVDAIAGVPIYGESPLNKVVINSITIDGPDMPEPEKLPAL